ncbi:hypothetical protein CGRA01v4_14635 [Colletotrichum graminicola]|nr:hypothetical protein CGRA01v4_14635 [Colletotrichum graminicola]
MKPHETGARHLGLKPVATRASLSNYYCFDSPLNTETPRRQPQRQQLVCVCVFNPDIFHNFLPLLPCTSVYLRYLLLPRTLFSSLCFIPLFSSHSQCHSENLFHVPSHLVPLCPTSFDFRPSGS